ncbi:glycosyltransferase [Hahella sp. KA22]|uniref:glycosyltransferase n=1 Tax=Hahella sp. KA22 TaxID=1628392 RepID=UPI000FDF4EA3|nr:glycosyltransferase [Hahella sp. KA22]AZZ92831.1 glycosyltransferase [Hahella sp. KA22]QAY56205.1 glycosyltransferase [Hahella sp. KA22]
MTSTSSQRKVVVQVVQHLSPGGIESICLELQSFAGSNADVHLVSLEGRESQMVSLWPRLSQYAGVMHFLDKPPGLQPRLLLKLAALFKSLKADVVHTHHIGPLLYGGAAARLARIPVLIHTEHDAWHLGLDNHQSLASKCLKFIRPQLVADAEIVADHIRSRIPHAQPRVIPNGIDTRRFKPGDKAAARRSFGLPDDQAIIGCAARMHEVKGHDILLDAMFRLPPNVHLALAGKGPQEAHLQRQVRDLNLSDRVHFLGLVDDMPRFYQALDVFCLASKAEGMPLSPLEAQACGARAVITDVGGSREALCPTTGILVPADNSAALAKALRYSLRTTLSADPRDFVMQYRDIRGMVAAYDQLHSVAC